MIKFFRHIRKRLLSENKFSKYLVYAVGEIILVVIGILIALQINNWNETRKEKAYEEQVYQQIYDDISSDIEGYAIAIDRYKKRDSLLHDVLYDKVPLVAYDTITNQNQQDFTYGINLILNYANLHNRTKGYELYKSIANTQLEGNELSDLIEDYYPRVYSKEEEKQYFVNHLIKNFNLLQQKKWHLDYEFNRKLNPLYVEYIKSDAFKTRLWDYQFIFIKLFARDLKELDEKAKIIKEKIKKRLEDN